MTKILKYFLVILAFIPSLCFAVYDSLFLDLAKVSEESIHSINPITLDSNGDRIISEALFISEKVSLDKPNEKSEQRRMLKAKFQSYIARNKELIKNINNGEIAISDDDLKFDTKHDLTNNQRFLESSYEDFTENKIEGNIHYYLTNVNDENVIISRTEIEESSSGINTLEVDLVMSNPDNILKNRLNLQGAVKRASVDNIRSIIRDIRTNNPTIKKVVAYVISPILESNYRRMGFETSFCL
ncbi:hypothetical protein [Photobacterium leiognathi]|uniref:Uncharacterized protein n=1 Tax=Photobacterium leiognathi subsp. mandapamensis TaxID=48408 RepID=A0A2T3KV85_PHOLD|nr:hypothetical protein [Photobacterium leiognathi]PSV10910.1 hypothetical protein C0W93_10480 [Photobacterium leiognathi subsp. mandapamensis]